MHTSEILDALPSVAYKFRDGPYAPSPPRATRAPPARDRRASGTGGLPSGCAAGSTPHARARRARCSRFTSSSTRTLSSAHAAAPRGGASPPPLPHIFPPRVASWLARCAARRGARARPSRVRGRHIGDHTLSTLPKDARTVLQARAAALQARRAAGPCAARAARPPPPPPYSRTNAGSHETPPAPLRAVVRHCRRAAAADPRARPPRPAPRSLSRVRLAPRRRLPRGAPPAPLPSCGRPAAGGAAHHAPAATRERSARRRGGAPHAPLRARARRSEAGCRCYASACSRGRRARAWRSGARRRARAPRARRRRRRSGRRRRCRAREQATGGLRGRGRGTGPGWRWRGAALSSCELRGCARGGASDGGQRWRTGCWRGDWPGQHWLGERLVGARGGFWAALRCAPTAAPPSRACTRAPVGLLRSASSLVVAERAGENARSLCCCAGADPCVLGSRVLRWSSSRVCGATGPRGEVADPAQIRLGMAVRMWRMSLSLRWRHGRRWRGMRVSSAGGLFPC